MKGQATETVAFSIGGDMQYQNMRNAYSNQEKVIFPGVGPYRIPELKPIDIEVNGSPFIRFDQCLKDKNPEGKIVHFFTDDYIFDRVWRDPDRYVPILARYRAVVAPDFSIYVDHPEAVQIFNHFKKHWLGAYWQSVGLKVIPCIRWQVERPITWTLDGEPTGGTICVSTHGSIKGHLRKQDFLQRLQEVVCLLHPSRVVVFGDFFPGLYDLEFDGDLEHVSNQIMEEKREAAGMGQGRSGQVG